MSRPLQLTAWQQQLASRFPDLPAAVVAVLALYSFGVLCAHVCGLSAVCLWLGKALALPYDALRKRLREFYLEAGAKSGVRQGQKRQDFDPADSFVPLLRWVLSLWSGRHLALALDVTNLGDRFHVLAVSVVVGGVGIPVAWKVLLGGVPEPWNPHWQALLRRLQAAVPADWTVLVLSDRGLESPELFRHLTGLGWHPLMRVKKGGKFHPKGWGRSYSLGDLVRRAGASLSVEGRAYAGAKLACTLLARWDEGYDEPWLLLTDLPPEAANAVWYGLRAWVEQGFQVIKGGGWDWQETRMEDPGRVERLWLVLTVATLWVVAVGAQDEAQEQREAERKRLAWELAQGEEQARARREREQQRRQKQQEAQQARRQRQAARRERRQAARAAKQPQARGRRRSKEEGQPRVHRLSVRGLAVLAALWQRGENQLPHQLPPQPWPPPCHPASTLTEEEFLSQQTYP